MSAADRSRLSRQGWLGLVLLCSSALLMAALAVAPYIWLSQLDPVRDEQRDELAFVQKRLASGGVRPGAAITAADDVGPLFVDGATPGLSVSNLETLASKAAKDAGIAVERIQPLQSEPAEGVQPVRLDIVTKGTIANLRNFIVALEHNEPLLFITEAKMTVEGAAEGEAVVDPAVTAVFRVEAFALQPVSQ